MSSISALLRHPQFRLGVRETLPIMPGIASWALVTGVAMVKAGLAPGLALLMSFTVYAGSAQLSALPLMMIGTPVWGILAAAFCINLRFIVFSIQWRPFVMHLPLWRRLGFGYLSGDMTYVLFMKRFPRPERLPGQMQFYLGSTSVNWLGWQVPSVAGILLADVMPTNWGLGFAGVLALLGVVYTMLSDRATTLAALVAGGAAIAAFALPLRLYIVVAIVAAICAGLVFDGTRSPPRREASA
jgi:predicted branched-subunit amino acid permease